MSRLSFRPRPLDIHKKLPVLKSFKDFEDEENPSSITRNSQLLRITNIEVDNEVNFSFSQTSTLVFCFFGVYQVRYVKVPVFFCIIRCSLKCLARNWFQRYQHLSFLLWIHMKEITLGLLISLVLIYAQEEVTSYL